MEYLAYSLMDSAYAKVTADTEYHLPEFKLTFSWQKYFKSAWLTFTSISTLLAILTQAGVAEATYNGPGRYVVTTNGSCLNVRTGPSTCHRSVKCNSNGSRLPRVVGYRKGFARLSTGNYVSANWINKNANREYASRRIPREYTPDYGIGGNITLKRGSRGEAVAELQRALGNVSVTGYYGSVTQRAVRDFQANNGLRPDGVAGAETLSYLGLGSITIRRPSTDYPLYRNDSFSSTVYRPYPNAYPNDSYRRSITLRRGSRGEAVAELQRALGNLPVTGYYDSSTERAVRNFQASLGFRPDGVAGAETLQFLGVSNMSTRPYYSDYSRSYNYSRSYGYSGISVGGP
ncbi:peptidoglycan-binding protein [Brasilonema sp. UFV-L1]|uniref:peptidoglycan-binding domain-containing protein n=1 Tax=Brasilonema sp. UFV-L1 TaxID=2234130 RepID=UPI00145FCAB3|nr:peptidoglycan-binding protein [Brasilonema sp. UFV-L1]NMG08849.1 peptidoglycan-binding protein [Brasilonema sp. UFV-L1]